MKIDLEKGLPVWVWGILFLLVVLPFSFRRAPNQELPLGESVTSTISAPADFNTAPIIPTPTIAPAVTESNLIEIAPAPRPAGE